jgi:hypothetical protein
LAAQALTGRIADPGDLLERGPELAKIERLIARARSGAGLRLLVEGPAGAGKTRLLEAAVRAGRASGMRVLEASASELESELGFGVVRSLFEGVLLNAGAEGRRSLLSGAARQSAPVVWPGGADSAAPAEPAAVLHGLFWLVSNLAEREPLLLVVDDAHWADRPSLRFLAYLARRLSGLPVLLLVAVRLRESAAHAELLSALSTDSFGEALRPAPLSEEAVGHLIGDRFGPAAAREFVVACHAATGGNPFLVGELLAALAIDRIAPTADNAQRVDKARRGRSPTRWPCSAIAASFDMPRRSRDLARVRADTLRMRWRRSLCSDQRGRSSSCTRLSMPRFTKPSRLAGARRCIEPLLDCSPRRPAVPTWRRCIS